MTAQNEGKDTVAQQTTDTTDPLGPITLPTRSKVGARAMALVGTVGLTAFALAAATSDINSTWPTIITE
ncbi:hypothetical protein GCM10009745_25530 [Kribbella yunnanensis]|uniref:Uncharacterized protein n=1 Tax=Kribbella yunnanensis TaxID=190194 RepID=A0ABP4T0L5_9ACTN